MKKQEGDLELDANYCGVFKFAIEAKNDRINNISVDCLMVSIFLSNNQKMINHQCLDLNGKDIMKDLKFDKADKMVYKDETAANNNDRKLVDSIIECLCFAASEMNDSLYFKVLKVIFIWAKKIFLTIFYKGCSFDIHGFLHGGYWGFLGIGCDNHLQYNAEHKNADSPYSISPMLAPNSSLIAESNGDLP